MEWHETCKCKCRLDARCNIKKYGINVNENINTKNWLITLRLIKNLCGEQVVNVTMIVINYVMLENIYIMKIVKLEKKFINYIPNVLKISINLSCLK